MSKIVFFPFLSKFKEPKDHLKRHGSSSYMELQCYFLRNNSWKRHATEIGFFEIKQ